MRKGDAAVKAQSLDMVHEIDICEYVANRCENDLIIDIREKWLFELGTISEAVNIPIQNIRQLYHLPKDKKIYVFCQVGEISGEIVELLDDAGYHAYNLAGGYRKYLRSQISEQEQDI